MKWKAKYKEALSKQVSLLHDSDELLFADLSVSISVSFVDHFLELVVGHGLS